MNNPLTSSEIETLFSASEAEREMIADAIRHANTSIYGDLLRSLEGKSGLLLDADLERAVTIFDDRYPEMLRQIYAPPLVLFVRGTLPQPKPQPAPPSVAIGIVGARTAGPRVTALVQRLACGVAESGAIVISGLAYGVDAAAHRGAMVSQTGITIAVLGTPLQKIYPAAHAGLAEQIVERGGALISQYASKSAVFPSNFLERNRIIAGMSRGVLVAQAGERSGSLATARFALEENREVMALPGDVLDDAFAGSNRLIREGATLVTTVEEILMPFEELLDKKSQQTEKPHKDLPQWLLGIGSEVMPLAEFISHIPSEIPQHEAILRLELAAAVILLPGEMIQRLI